MRILITTSSPFGQLPIQLHFDANRASLFALDWYPRFPALQSRHGLESNQFYLNFLRETTAPYSTFNLPRNDGFETFSPGLTEGKPDPEHNGDH